MEFCVMIIYKVEQPVLKWEYVCQMESEYTHFVFLS